MFQTSDCGLELRRVTVIELLGSPPQETGRIKDDKLTADVIQGLRYTTLIYPQLHMAPVKLTDKL